MYEALTQANDLYGNAVSQADSIAMRTAVHVVLNTAIQEHERELAAIYDKHAAEVQDLRSRMAATPDPVTALLGLVNEQVQAALETWLDGNLNDRMDSWYGNDVDITDDVKKVLEEEIDLDDLVQEKVAEYFSSNSFSIEAR
jgi:hypothetical protein